MHSTGRTCRVSTFTAYKNTLFGKLQYFFWRFFFVSKRAGELTSGRVAQSESERSSSGFSKVSPLHQSPHGWRGIPEIEMLFPVRSYNLKVLTYFILNSFICIRLKKKKKNTNPSVMHRSYGILYAINNNKTRLGLFVFA